MVECYRKEAQLEAEETPNARELHIDGSLTKERSGSRQSLARLEDQKLEYALRFRFLALNNKVDYKALIQEMELTLEVGAKKLVAHNDSQLVVEQVKGNYKAKKPSMMKYLGKVKQMK